MNFILNNQKSFQTNSSIHSINNRNKHHLHRTNDNLSCFQKSTFYAGIRIFNRVPLTLLSLKNEKTKFKVALRKILYYTILLLSRWIFLCIKMVHSEVYNTFIVF
jgi:hypothetical protein